MGGSAIKAGETFVEFFVEKSRMLRDLRGIEGTLKSVGKSVSSVGLKFASLAALVVTGLIPAVNVFASFEENMSAVAAVTGATTEELEQLEKTARKLGATTSASARDAAAGMAFLGMAGFNTQQIIEGIPSVLNLKLAGGATLELAEAADIASDVSSAFELTAAEIARVSDVMAEAASSSNTSIQGLGESFKFAAPAGKAAGQEIETVTAALGKLGDSGLKGGIAGRNLAIIFKQLARTDVQERLKAIGVEVADASGNFRDLEDIISDLKGPLSLKTEVERVRFLNEAFGESAKAAQILISSADGFQDLKAKLDGAAGAAERIAKVRADNLTGDFRLLLSAMQEAAIRAIEPMKVQLRELVQRFTGVVGVVGDFLSENSALVTGLVAAAGVAGSLGVALTTIGTATVVAGTAVGGLRTVLAAASAIGGTFSSVASAAAKAVAALSTSTTTSSAATTVYSASVASATVMTTAWAASVNAATASVLRLQATVAAASGAAGTAMTTFSGVGTQLARISSNVVTTTAGFSVLRTIAVAVAGALSTTAGVVALVVAGVAALGYGLVKLQQHFGIFDPFIEAIQAIYDRIRSELLPVISSIGTALADLGSVALQLGRAFFAAFEPVKILFNEVFGTIGLGLLDQFASAVKVAADVFQSVFTTAIEIIRAELETVLGLFELGLQAAEKAGVVVSRDERDRGRRLDKQLQQIKDRRAAQEQPKEQPNQQPVPGNAGENIPDPDAERRRAEEQTLMDSLKSYADQIHQSNMTSQEKFRATMEKLQQARAAGFLSNEDFNREASRQQQILQDEIAQAEEERQRRLEEAADKQRSAMYQEIQARADLSRANKDFIGEMKALGQGAMEARKAGFNGLATELLTEQLQGLTARAADLEQQYADSLIAADMQTSSAQEAMFGIGTETVDDQALEEAQAARRAAEKTTEVLEDIRAALEE